MPLRRRAISSSASPAAMMLNDVNRNLPTSGGKPVPNLARNAAIAMSEQEKAQGQAPRRRSFLPKKIRK